MPNLSEFSPDWPAWRLSDVAFGGRRLDRSGPSGGYWKPRRIEATGGRIEYWFVDPDEPIGVVANVADDAGAVGRPSQFVASSGRQLEDLVEARLAPDSAIVEYAQRWGVLEICRHGLPRTHSAGLTALCARLGGDSMDDGGWEPAWAWRFFQRQAVLLLKASDRLRRGERLDRELWQELFDEDGPRLAFDRPLDFDNDEGAVEISEPLDLRTGLAIRRPPALSWVLPEDDWDRAVWECDLANQRWCAGLVTQSWLEVGRPEMLASWSADRAEVVIGARSLFGALAMKIALAASGSLSFALCHECRALFVPKRRAKPGQRTYCIDCREAKVPRRDASRDFRERGGAKPRNDR